MKPTKIFLTVLGATLTALLCVQFGGSRPVLAAGTALTQPDHTLKLKHSHDDDDNVTWEIKENGKGAFRLHVKPNQIIEWTNLDNKETKMSIIVNNTNDWQLVQGSWNSPTYGVGCVTCGQIDTTSGVIQLKFTGKSNTLNNHYKIAIPNPNRILETTYDYDMVDATIVWSETLKGDKRKTR